MPLRIPKSLLENKSLLQGGDSAVDLATAGKIDLAVSFQLKALERKKTTLGSNLALLCAVYRGNSPHSCGLFIVFLWPVHGSRALKHWDLKLDHGQIVVSPGSCETNLKGIYAVGDVATYPHKLKLILSGFAEAAVAAHAIRARIFPDQSFHFEYSTTSGVLSIETGNV